jgi:hypothetical protein
VKNGEKSRKTGKNAMQQRMSGPPEGQLFEIQDSKFKPQP